MLRATGRAPLVVALCDHWPAMLRLANQAVLNRTAFYLACVDAVSWMQWADGLPAATALEINTVNRVLFMGVMAAGWLADRVGSVPGMLTRHEAEAWRTRKGCKVPIASDNSQPKIWQSC